MKSLEHLSIKGLKRRRKHLMTMPITAERAALLNQIDAMIQAKIAPAQPARPKRDRPRLHRKYQAGIAIQQQSGQPQR